MITQNDVDDGEITPFNEGYMDYLFGKNKCPYAPGVDAETWEKGWIISQKQRPHMFRDLKIEVFKS